MVNDNIALDQLILYSFSTVITNLIEVSADFNDDHGGVLGIFRLASKAIDRCLSFLQNNNKYSKVLLWWYDFVAERSKAQR